MKGAYGRSQLLLPALVLAIGVALIVRTLAAGGGAGAYGVVFGLLFAVLGAVRLWLTVRAGEGA